MAAPPADATAASSAAVVYRGHPTRAADPTLERWFVRVSADRPEKGPYRYEALKSAFRQGRLRREASVRSEQSGAMCLLHELVEDDVLEEERIVRRARIEEAERAAAQQREHAGRSTGAASGVVMIVAGLGLSLLSFSTGNNGGMLFFGLVIVGFVRVVRAQSR